MSSLSHHGIKGQRWGVRRYQNKDGTRTAAGKARDDRRVLKKGHVVSRVHLQNKDKIYDNKKYVSTNDEDHKKWVGYFGNEYAHRWRPIYEQKYELKKDVYVANGKDVAKIISTKLNKEMVERDLKGLETEAKAKGINYNWAESNTEDRYSLLLARQTESGKQIIKELVKAGFGAVEDDHGKNVAKDPVIILNPKKNLKKKGKTVENREYLNAYSQWYTQELLKAFGMQHTSIGGTMYIEGNTLILGDSSYLEHHGIRGQRWGVRRFQNRDGSLTNAGRKRLGYATKGVTQTVGKAFKAGVKAGGNAVKAVKAYHEKKEAEKLEKKKEKASKTRIGVMANKDLFTNEEIRKLNERFKLEDEMKMATLQKGVEIAKAVGTIAQNVGTVAKTYEDVTGQSLSPIKRKAAEEKARQEKEDRERRLAREDAEEARKAAKEERDIQTHEQTLRKNIAEADVQEFTARKTKAEADSAIIKALSEGKKFSEKYGKDAGTDATGQSWVEKATSGGKNVFEQMKYDNDPEYRAAKDAHDEKVARKERMDYLNRSEKEREIEKTWEEDRKRALENMNDRSKSPRQDSDALFSQKGSLPIDKDRYRNNRAMEKAKQVKEDAAEERAKKHDEKAAKATIDDMMEARRQFTDSARANSNGAFDRETAANYIKGKAKELPSKLNPINAISKKITDRALKEQEAASRKAMEDEYKKASRLQGRDEANYTMYYNRVNALQAQGYSERQAKKVADTENPFSSKRNRRFEYKEKVGEIETTHRKNAKEINKANKELTDYYYKLVNGPGYEPGSPKREALDRKYAQKRGELERLEKDNNDMLDREKKKAKKILEHSLSIQNGVLFVDSSDSLTHHGVKGQRWGVRRFQNADGSLTPKGRKHYEKAIEKLDRKQTHSDALRGRLERQHPFAVTGSAILGAVAAGMSIAATGGASVAAIAAGSAISAAVNAGITHASYSVSEAWEGRGTKRRQKKRKEYEEMLNHDGLLVSDGTLYLEHHGVKGQRWGVRRFQNPDGTRTEAGKKHDAKLAAKAEKKQAKADMKAAKATAKAKAKDIKLTEKAENLRKREIERYEKMAVKQPHYKAAYETMAKHAKESDRSELLQINGAANGRSVIQGIGAAMILGAFVPTPIAVAGGIAIAKAMKMTNVDYARSVTTNARLNREARERKLKEAQSIKLEHSSAYGMPIQNGTLFINAGEPYLAHHGVKGMKWGKHLMAGKGVDAEGGGGGGFAEDDEKLKEMAKKAGMSVAELRTKMAGKLGGAASKVSIKDKHLVVNGNRSVGTRGLAVGETGEKPKSFKEKAYNALGGKYKTQAADAHREMVQKRNDADDKARRANAQGRAARLAKSKGAVQDYIANKEGAIQLEGEAKYARNEQWDATRRANSAQWKYDHSIAGLYDKATGKYKQVHKKTSVPNAAKRAEYNNKTSNKLYDGGKTKPKTAKEQAKAEIWKAADHMINSHDYYNNSFDPTVTAYGYDTAFRKKATDYARLAEGSYRRAAALGKQASKETSTSTRPRARKKKHTSGGSGVTVRRPGRKPVSRTKRVTQSSTGVKQRGTTGTGARVRRGA